MFFFPSPRTRGSHLHRDTRRLTARNAFSSPLRLLETRRFKFSDTPCDNGNGGFFGFFWGGGSEGHFGRQHHYHAGGWGENATLSTSVSFLTREPSTLLSDKPSRLKVTNSFAGNVSLHTSLLVYFSFAFH